MLQLSKKTHSDLINKWQTNRAFVKAYADLANEFDAFDKAFKCRKQQNLAQTEVATKKGNAQSAGGRSEDGWSGQMAKRD